MQLFPCTRMHPCAACAIVLNRHGSVRLFSAASGMRTGCMLADWACMQPRLWQQGACSGPLPLGLFWPVAFPGLPVHGSLRHCPMPCLWDPDQPSCYASLKIVAVRSCLLF